MTTRSLTRLFQIVLLVITAFLPGNGFSSEPYPNRPITMVMPGAAGGGMDVSIRAFCKFVEKELGQPIIVENKPGGGGVVGKTYVLQSKPDGYTLGQAASSTYFIHPHMRKTPYNPLTDITDVIAYAMQPFGLSVRVDAPWNSLEEVIEYARKNPGKFTYSTAGSGTNQHICLERIAMKEGIKWTQVPFRSASEAVMACLGGHTDATGQGSGDVLPHIRAGKLKLLLALTAKRWTDLPHVPTTLEKGYNFYAPSFISIYGPKGMPESIREKLESAFKNAIKDPSVIELHKKLYFELNYFSGKEFSDLWRSMYDEMGKVIKALGLEEK